MTLIGEFGYNRLQFGYNRSKNLFTVKYKNTESKDFLIDIVKKIIHKHNIREYEIEEKTAYTHDRIQYNERTIATGENITFESADEVFSSIYHST